MPEPPFFRGHAPLVKASLGIHAAALGVLAMSPPSWPFVAATLAANHAAIATAGLLPRSAWLGPNIRRLNGDTPNQIALTFDDGPDPVTTFAVLELLASAKMTGTFFCVGAKAMQHPDVVREIRARGHQIENHTHTHPTLFAFGRTSFLRREILLAQEALTSPEGRAPKFFRAPAGIQNPWLPPVLRETGLQLVSWTRRGFDTTTRDGRTVAERLTAGLRSGDILLMHDSGSAMDRNSRPVVLTALAEVLERMSKLGLVSRPITKSA